MSALLFMGNVILSISNASTQLDNTARLFLIMLTLCTRTYYCNNFNIENGLSLLYIINHSLLMYTINQLHFLLTVFENLKHKLLQHERKSSKITARRTIKNR